jgi:hypothetical protein
MNIIPQGPKHEPAIERLLDLTFGHNRHKKTVYRLREAVPAVSSLSFVMEEDGEVVASLRFWPVTLPNNEQALLLGPLAVLPALSGRGKGRAMVRHGLAEGPGLARHSACGRPRLLRTVRIQPREGRTFAAAGLGGVAPLPGGGIDSGSAGRRGRTHQARPAGQAGLEAHSRSISAQNRSAFADIPVDIESDLPLSPCSRFCAQSTGRSRAGTAKRSKQYRPMAEWQGALKKEKPCITLRRR